MNISRYANIDKFVNIRYIFFLLARRAYSWLFQLAQMWKLLDPGVGLVDFLTPACLFERKGRCRFVLSWYQTFLVPNCLSTVPNCLVSETDHLSADTWFQQGFWYLPHRRLLHKIQHYGIEGLTNKWIGSCLCQRKQKVVLDGYSSKESSVISGVPQGMVLGPLIYLLYVNDIADKISPQTRIKHFADDCLLYRTIDTEQHHKQLQQDLNTLVDWSHTWLMTFNAAKCHLLKITRKTRF